MASRASGLKKTLSFEAVRLASQERVQQRLPPERMFVLQLLPHLWHNLVHGALQDSVLAAALEVPKMVSQSGLQRRTVEQIVVFLRIQVFEVPKTLYWESAEESTIFSEPPSPSP